MQEQDVYEDGGRLPVDDKSGRVVKDVHKEDIEQKVDTQNNEKSRREAQVTAQDKLAAAFQALPDGKAGFLRGGIFGDEMEPRIAERHSGDHKKELASHLTVVY